MLLSYIEYLKLEKFLSKILIDCFILAEFIIIGCYTICFSIQVKSIQYREYLKKIVLIPDFFNKDLRVLQRMFNGFNSIQYENQLVKLYHH